MFGQALIGVAQPFILSVSTYYSDIWFTSTGRISATALVSMSNPFGAALGQLIGPIIATSPDKLPEMVMWVAIIGTVACVPSFFVQERPPTPPCASAATQKLGFKEGVRLVLKNKNFLLILVLVGFVVRPQPLESQERREADSDDSDSSRLIWASLALCHHC